MMNVLPPQRNFESMQRPNEQDFRGVSRISPLALEVVYSAARRSCIAST